MGVNVFHAWVVLIYTDVSQLYDHNLILTYVGSRYSNL